jgi:hypothetical protein
MLPRQCRKAGLSPILVEITYLFATQVKAFRAWTHVPQDIRGLLDMTAVRAVPWSGCNPPTPPIGLENVESDPEIGIATAFTGSIQQTQPRPLV